MKAYGLRGVLGLGILIGAIVFCFASATMALEENVQSTSSQPRSQANQPNKTKSKQNTSAALKPKQSKNSQPESNTQRTNANSRRQVESRRSERRQEQAALISTAAGILLNAIQKPAPNPTPPPAPVVVKTTPAQQKTAPRKRTPSKSRDDDVWSRINPVSK